MKSITKFRIFIFSKTKIESDFKVRKHLMIYSLNLSNQLHSYINITLTKTKQKKQKLLFKRISKICYDLKVSICQIPNKIF
jgi:acetolactate synthase regulatory subunit